MVRYPAPGMTPSTPREDWPRLPGVIDCQCGPGRVDGHRITAR